MYNTKVNGENGVKEKKIKPQYSYNWTFRQHRFSCHYQQCKQGTAESLLSKHPILKFYFSFLSYFCPYLLCSGVNNVNFSVKLIALFCDLIANITAKKQLIRGQISRFASTAISWLRHLRRLTKILQLFTFMAFS